MFSLRCLALISALFVYEGVTVAQSPFVGPVGPNGALFVGAAGPYGGNVVSTSTQTILQLAYRVALDGEATKATFGWSASPCLAAVKIKFFRPSTNTTFSFVTERGPFDVTEPARTPTQPNPTFPPVIQTVALNPPVALLAGDAIAITNMTSCGGPTYIGGPVPPITFTYVLPGDVSSTFAILKALPSGAGVFVSATGSTRILGLVLNRFQITLTASDPRTGRVAVGTPNALGHGSAGFFSLPDLTGDPDFPEVAVKMVDARFIVPTLGGGFWFFHAPLTDVQYTLTVKDRVTGAVKTYSNVPGDSGQLCGGADTSAFPP